MIKKLIEIDSLIKQYKKDFLECRTEQDKMEISKNIEKLEKIWFQNTNCNYPMLLNENNKQYNFKNILQDIKSKDKKERKEAKKNKEKVEKNGLDMLIERATENNNLVNNVLYDKNYASDEVDNFRKRRK